ncbi:MAG: hypothetical protein JXD23_05385 [Spirochaetales bacterium]|nr:hypothetical protein [Spirochaetales bacterium]
MKNKSSKGLTGIVLILAIGLLASCPPPKTPSNTVALTRIDLYLYVFNATGTFTIELRDSSGDTPAIWSGTVDANTLTSNTWNAFIVPAVSLTKGATYRIYATRSDVHNPGVNEIDWESSNSVGDEYPPGVCSTPNAEQDFMFRTYNDDVLDQQMTTIETGYALSSGDFLWWQEFVPEG